MTSPRHNKTDPVAHLLPDSLAGFLAQLPTRFRLGKDREVMGFTWDSLSSGVHQSVRATLGLAVASFALGSPLAHADIQVQCQNGTESGQPVEWVQAYLKSLKVDKFIQIESVTQDIESPGPESSLAHSLSLKLDPKFSDKSSFELHTYKELGLGYESVALPTLQNKPKRQNKSFSRAVKTVSSREILLALSYPGRTLRIGPNHSLSLSRTMTCQEALTHLKDHVGVRQSIAAWSESMDLNWPDGGPAYWNTRYWVKGTPLNQSARGLHEATTNFFREPKKYAIGCYTAAKVLYSHAIYDYFIRTYGADSPKALAVHAQLTRDKDPLVDTEPPVAWNFEKDHDTFEDHIDGKLVQQEHGISPKSVVPGDWLYLLNTHEPSAQKTGYEGSNAIYVGLNRYASYYDPTGPRYTTLEKINDVYQWRNGVWDRPRDLKKEKKISPSQLMEFFKPPEQGGFLLPWRLVPKTDFALKPSKPLDAIESPPIGQTEQASGR